jgi:hypothetical protein
MGYLAPGGPIKVKIAIICAAFVIGAGLLGFVFKPTDEQQRPLASEPGAGGDAHDDHGHHH